MGRHSHTQWALGWLETRLKAQRNDQGGFALEVVDSTNADHTVVSHLIAVTAGIYANGFVSVTGDQVKDGLTVVVPA